MNSVDNRKGTDNREGPNQERKKIHNPWKIILPPKRKEPNEYDRNRIMSG